MGFLKGLFGQSSSAPTVSASQARVQKMEARVEGMRKGDIKSKDSQVRGQVQASSARDYVTRSLGKQNAPSGGTSLARMGSGGGGANPFGSGIRSTGGGIPTLPPKLPPMRPLGR
jgi:hypothetical protein